MEERIKYLQKRFSILQEKRKQFEKVWNLAAEFCAVNSKLYFKDVNGRFVQKIFDSTARNDLIAFASSMKSLLAPSSQRYQRIKPSRPELEESSEVRAFLEYLNNLIFKFRYSASSQFSTEADVLLTQIGIYGQSPWFVDDDIGRGILYRTFPMAECYAEVGANGKVDTIYRAYELSLRQAMQEFGNKASAKMKERFEKDPDKKIKLLHAVEKRQNRDVKSLDYKGMPFASYHVNLDDSELIYESGYRTMPYQLPHYMKDAYEAYGSSPAMVALNDILTINEMSKTVLRVGQLQGNPPLLALANFADAQRAGMAGAIVPGGLNASGQPTIQPMQYGGNLSITLELQNQVRETIDRAFLKPFFMALSQNQSRQMTAEEARIINAETSQLLAPMGERLSKEWLSGTVEREVDIIRSYGLLDDVPDELIYEGSLQVEFESPMYRMQQSGEVKGLMETLESAISLSQVDPSVLDHIDMGEALDYIANYKGVPTKILRTKEAIAAMGEARAQQEQAQQMLQAAPVLSESIKNINQAGVR